MEILLQKRSKNKDSHPGCLDCSSAGHIPAGVDFIPSAIRELKEELGIDAKEDEFVYCGQTVGKRTNVFYGEEFIDNQVSNIYYIERNMEADKFNIQKEELESVVWMKYDDAVLMVKNNTIPNCVKVEELEMLGQKINKESKDIRVLRFFNHLRVSLCGLIPFDSGIIKLKVLCKL